jgi:hypothetical protein
LGTSLAQFLQQRSQALRIAGLAQLLDFAGQCAGAHGAKIAGGTDQHVCLAGDGGQVARLFASVDFPQLTLGVLEEQGDQSGNALHRQRRAQFLQIFGVQNRRRGTWRLAAAPGLQAVRQAVQLGQ